MISKSIDIWHEFLNSRDLSALDTLLDDDVVFHSPVVFTPQKGKEITHLYLSAAFNVLLNDTFKYVREVHSGNNSIMEFKLDIEGVLINGVDMVTWSESGKIIDFQVMVRPLQGMNKLHEKMQAMLEAFQSGKLA